MKKFIVMLILLIIIAAVIFYFGYVSFRIPEGSYGIVLTKTNGFDHPVLSPGHFQWMWQGLIPTNLRLFHIRLQERNIPLDFTGRLPSSEAYENYADTQEDFTVRLKTSLRYRIQPQFLPEIFERAGIQADSAEYGNILDDVYSTIEADAETLFSQTVNSLVESGDFGKGVSAFQEMLESRISRDFPQLENVDITISEYSFPDQDLYSAVKENYLEYLEKSHEIAVHALEAASSARTREISRIEVLKEYGELLQQYPVLLEIFKDMSDEPLIILPETE